MGADPSGIFYLVFSDGGAPVRYRARRQRGRADLEGIVEDIAGGRYGKARRVVAFNLVEGWARDVTLYVALACSRRSDDRDNRHGSSRQSCLEDAQPHGHLH